MGPIVWIVGGLAAALLLGGENEQGASACLDEHMPPDLRASTRKLLDSKYPPTAYAAAADLYESQGYPLASGCFRKRAGGAAPPKGFNPYEPATWGDLGPVLGGGWTTTAGPGPAAPPAGTGPAGGFELPAEVAGPLGRAAGSWRDYLPRTTEPGPERETDPLGFPAGIDPNDPSTWTGQPLSFQIRAGDTPKYLANWYTGDGAKWPQLGPGNPHLGEQKGSSFAGWFPGNTIILPGDWNPWQKDAPPAQAAASTVATIHA